MTLQFFEDIHQYRWLEEPETKLTSVSTLIGHYHEKFDSELRSRKYAEKHGLTQEEVLKMWSDKATKAATKGTLYHKKKEDELLCKPNVVRHPEVNGIKQALDITELKPGIYPELILYHPKYNLVGTADYVEIYKDGTFDLKDHKTNEKLEFSGFPVFNQVTKQREPKKMFQPLSHLDDCVAGDTKLILQNGLVSIIDVIGKEVEIWNGKKWSKVKPFSTGKKELFRITFSDGSYLDATENHIFLIKHRLDKDFQEKTLLEILKIKKTTKWTLRVPSSTITWDGGVEEKYAYDFGFILGDGTVTSHVIKAELHNKDNLITFSDKAIKKDYNGVNVVKFKLDKLFCKKLKYEKGLPQELFSWNKSSVLQFVAGWMDADGTITKGGINLYGKECKLRDLQLLLTKCGIRSSIRLVQKKGVETNFCKRKEDLWSLYTSFVEEIPTQRIDRTRIQKKNSTKNYYQRIKSIVKLEGIHPTFCLTEKELHQCVFNNVLTKQCNGIHYTLQLSSYAFMLEEAGYECKSLTIHHVIFDEDEKDIMVIDYPITYLKKEVRNLFEHFKQFKSKQCN